MVDVDSIRSAEIFTGLSASDLEGLAGIASERGAARGEHLFRRGELADALYVVASGSFALTLPLRYLDDHVEITVEVQTAGDALGWSALVAPHRSIYSALCTEKGVLWTFPRADLEALMQANPGLGWHLARNLNQLIGSRLRGLQDLWTEEVEQSMARVHYWTQERPGGAWR
jgi:CRP/FNR family transcriptional regulator, dissimilatory nitrate respiration regulator